MIKEKSRKGSKAKVIIILSVVIIIVAAILIVPRYNRHLKNSRAKEVRTALDDLRLTIDQIWKTSGTISGITLEGAIQKANISDKTTNKWQLVVSWKLVDVYTTEMVDKLKNVSTNQMAYVSPYKLIMAVAKAGNPVGEGTKVWYYGDTNAYHGFGVDEQVEPDWSSIFPNP
ncbi:MAG: hypothetical protein PHY48_04015 [Candidatus Cloacimonetes bacterium]|nr:hypothetical protein [Candidatus Cloacimonadota bacterium]